MKEAMKLALEALENSVDLVSHEARNAEELYGKYPTRLARVQGLVALEVAHEKAITALREALAEQPAQQEPEYAWPTVADYENDVGFEVNQAFKMGWDMARTTNSFLNQLAGVTPQPAQQCKWPTCQSEEYQQALAEQIKRELVGEQPAQRKPQTLDELWRFFIEAKLKEKNT